MTRNIFHEICCRQVTFLVLTLYLPVCRSDDAILSSLYRTQKCVGVVYMLVMLNTKAWFTRNEIQPVILIDTKWVAWQQMGMFTLN